MRSGCLHKKDSAGSFKLTRVQLLFETIVFICKSTLFKHIVLISLTVFY